MGTACGAGRGRHKRRSSRRRALAVSSSADHPLSHSPPHFHSTAGGVTRSVFPTPAPTRPTGRVHPPLSTAVSTPGRDSSDFVAEPSDCRAGTSVERLCRRPVLFVSGDESRATLSPTRSTDDWGRASSDFVADPFLRHAWGRCRPTKEEAISSRWAVWCGPQAQEAKEGLGQGRVCGGGSEAGRPCGGWFWREGAGGGASLYRGRRCVGAGDAPVDTPVGAGGLGGDQR